MSGYRKQHKTLVVVKVINQIFRDMLMGGTIPAAFFGLE